MTQGTNINSLDVTVKYENEGIDKATKENTKFAESADKVTGALADESKAAEESKKKTEAATTAEIESAKSYLRKAEKVELLVSKLQLLSKQYADVSKKEGDQSKALNAIALQYKNTQDALARSAGIGSYDTPEPEQVIPYQNMGAEALEAKSKLELLEMKLKQIDEEMKVASSSTDNQSKRLLQLGIQYNTTAEQIQKMKDALAKANEPKVEEPVVEETTPAYENMSAEMVTSASKADLLRMKLDELKRKLDECSESTTNQTDKMISLGMQYNSTKEQLEKLTETTEKSGEEAEKSSGRFGIFLKQLRRIAVYRAIRTALKEITSSFKEGVQNLYQWSLANDNTFAKSMDSLATSTLYLKNALGTALAPVIEDVVVPAIYAISDAVAEAVNWFNQLIAILQGEGTYTKAIRKQTQFATATGAAAKELNRMLLGFDEINKLSDNSSGSGSSTDYSGMFETATVNEELSAKLDSLRLTIKDVFFEWTNLDPEQKLEKVLTGANGIFGAVAGFAMTGTLAGGLTGAVAGVLLSVILNSLLFDHDGTISESELKKLLGVGVGGLIGGIVGFSLMPNVTGAILGFEAGAALTAIIQQDKVLFTASGKISEESLKTLIIPAVVGVLGGIAGFLITKNPTGAILGFTATTALTAKLMNIDWKKGGKSETKSSLFDSLMPALMGFLVGGSAALYLSVALNPAAGMLIGFTIGVALTLAIQSVDWANKEVVWNAASDLGGVSDFNGKNTVDSSTINQVTENATTKTINQVTENATTKKSGAVVTARAGGGYVDSGSLFIAGESGAEFVGNINGRTGVMNTDQFSEANRPVTEAVYAIGSAIVGAVNGIEMPSVKIGDREIYKASERGKRLTGSSLVIGAR